MPWRRRTTKRIKNTKASCCLAEQLISIASKCRANAPSWKRCWQRARHELETRTALTDELQTKVKVLLAAAEQAEAHQSQENAERQQALAAARREVIALRDQAASCLHENEQLIGENAALAADLSVALEELQAARKELTALENAAETHLFEDDEQRQQVLAAARAEAAKLQLEVQALEQRVSTAQVLETRLQEAWTVTTRLEGELALANAAAATTCSSAWRLPSPSPSNSLSSAPNVTSWPNMSKRCRPILLSSPVRKTCRSRTPSRPPSPRWSDRRMRRRSTKKWHAPWPIRSARRWLTKWHASSRKMPSYANGLPRAVCYPCRLAF